MVGVLQRDDEEQVGQDGAQEAAPTFGAPAPQARGSYSGKIAGSEPKGSGSFVNLEKFIEANKEPTKTMASNVVSTTKGEGEKITGAIGTKANTAIGGMKAAQPSTLDLSKMSAAELGGDAIKDYMTLSDEEKANWGAVPDFSTEAQQAKQFDTGIQNTATGSGLSDLVGGFQKAKGLTATAGQRGFDTMLLQKDPNAQTEVAGLRDWSKQYVAPAAQEAKTRVETEGTARLKAATDLRDMLRPQVGAQISSLSNEATGLRDTSQNSFKSDIDSRLAAKGLNITDIKDPAILNMYFNGAGSSLDYLAPEQLAKYNALRRLSGGAEYTPTQLRSIESGNIDKIINDIKFQKDLARAEFEAANVPPPTGPAGTDMFGNIISAPTPPPGSFTQTPYIPAVDESVKVGGVDADTFYRGN
jgi:hypothetical protein